MALIGERATEDVLSRRTLGGGAGARPAALPVEGAGPERRAEKAGSEPPSAEPPSAEPPSAEPPSAELLSSEPLSAEPPSSEPPSSEPPSSEPGIAKAGSESGTGEVDPGPDADEAGSEHHADEVDSEPRTEAGEPEPPVEGVDMESPAEEAGSDPDAQEAGAEPPPAEDAGPGPDAQEAGAEPPPAEDAGRKSGDVPVASDVEGSKSAETLVGPAEADAVTAADAEPTDPVRVSDNSDDEETAPDGEAGSETQPVAAGSDTQPVAASSDTQPVVVETVAAEETTRLAVVEDGQRTVRFDARPVPEEPGEQTVTLRRVPGELTVDFSRPGDETQVIRVAPRSDDGERTQLLGPRRPTGDAPPANGRQRPGRGDSIAGAESPNFADDPTGRLLRPEPATEEPARTMTVMNLERPPEIPAPRKSPEAED